MTEDNLLLDPGSSNMVLVQSTRPLLQQHLGQTGTLPKLKYNPLIIRVVIALCTFYQIKKKIITSLADN